jgi:hypothetical protein
MRECGNVKMIAPGFNPGNKINQNSEPRRSSIIVE